MEKRMEDILRERLGDEPSARCVYWNGAWLSRGDLANLAEESRGVLEAAGFGSGMRLASLLPNSPMVLALSLACWRLGGAFVPLNPRIGAEGLARILDRVDPFALVAPKSLEALAESLRERGVPGAIVPLDAPPPPFVGRSCEAGETDMAVLFATAGTTGLPKMVSISHGNLSDNIEASMERIRILRPEDVFLNVLPCFHTLGYTVAGMLPLVGRMSQAILPSFIPAEAPLRIMSEAGVTIIVAVPTMIGLLLGAAARGIPVPKGVRYILCGGDRLNPALDDRTRAVFGVPIIEGYGLTECSPVVSVNPDEEHRKLGTVGPLLRGYEAELRDLEGNRIEGNRGVLWLKGPSVSKGYFRDPENMAARFRDGWFDSGDLARIDEDGFLSILDRATDLIIVGGFNVYPQEVEHVLLEHPGVAGAAAVGEDNPVTGQIVKAFVIPRDPESPPTSKDLIAWCKERLPHFKVPRKVKIVSEFPLSSVGKVLRRELRER